MVKKWDPWHIKVIYLDTEITRRYLHLESSLENGK